MLLLSLSSPLGAIHFEDALFPELILSGRALAMGNAFVAKADDAASAFYNPAGLGTVRKTQFHLSNFHIGMNKGQINVGNTDMDDDDYAGFFKGFDPDELRQSLRENPGNIAGTRFYAMPNFTTRYFTLGYLLAKSSKATIGTEDDALFEYVERTDYGPYAAANFSFFGGIVKIGGSATWLRRKEFQNESDPDEPIADELPYRKGHMLHVVAGGKFTLPFRWLPTFAGTVHNSGDDEFTASTSSGEGAPATIEQTVVAGFSLTPKIGRRSRLHIEVNYKDLLRAYDNVEDSRRWTGGIELDFSRKFFFRLGYGDGFGSAGIGLKSRTFILDLTTYAVDTMAQSWRGQEDRSFSLTFSSGL